MRVLEFQGGRPAMGLDEPGGRVADRVPARQAARQERAGALEAREVGRKGEGHPTPQGYPASRQDAQDVKGVVVDLPPDLAQAARQERAEGLPGLGLRKGSCSRAGGHRERRGRLGEELELHRGPLAPALADVPAPGVRVRAGLRVPAEDPGPAYPLPGLDGRVVLEEMERIGVAVAPGARRRRLVDPAAWLPDDSEGLLEDRQVPADRPRAGRLDAVERAPGPPDRLGAQTGDRARNVPPGARASA